MGRIICEKHGLQGLVHLSPDLKTAILEEREVPVVTIRIVVDESLHPEIHVTPQWAQARGLPYESRTNSLRIHNELPQWVDELVIMCKQCYEEYSLALIP